MYVAPSQVDTTTIEFALSVLEPEPWTPTPLLLARAVGERLRASVWLKREDCTPTGSFKLRGALTTARALSGCTPDAGVYVASAGNYGAAVVYACARYGIPVTVVAPEGATASKLDRIRLYDGKIEMHGRDFDEAKAFARDEALRAGAAFWEDGAIEQMAVGAGAIGVEILADSDPWDMVIVPLGNGSLIKGIAREVSAGVRALASLPRRRKERLRWLERFAARRGANRPRSTRSRTASPCAFPSRESSTNSLVSSTTYGRLRNPTSSER